MAALPPQLLEEALNQSSEPIAIFAGSGVLVANPAFKSLVGGFVDKSNATDSSERSYFDTQAHHKLLEGLMNSSERTGSQEIECEIPSAQGGRYLAVLTPAMNKTVICVFKQLYPRQELLELVQTHALTGHFAIIELSEDQAQAYAIHRSDSSSSDMPFPRNALFEPFSSYLSPEEHQIWLGHLRASVGTTSQVEKPLSADSTSRYEYTLKGLPDSSRGRKRILLTQKPLLINGHSEFSLSSDDHATQQEASANQIEIFRALVEASSRAVIIARTVSDGKDIELQYLNRKARAIFGGDLHDWRTSSVSLSNIYPLMIPEFMDVLNRARRSPSKEYEDHAYMQPITNVRVDLTVQQLSEEVFALVMRDTYNNSERLEELVRERTAQLEEALQAKSRFLATMSHEMRTPLTGVMGSLSLLADTSLTAEQRECCHVAEVCGEQLLVVINDVLDLSRLEEGKLKLEQASFRLIDALEECLNAIAYTADQKQVRLLLDVPINLQATVIATDPVRLRQILLNLLGNAVKFTSSGQVVLRARGKEMSTDKIELTIAVEDTGIGIPDHVKTTLFTPFSQGDSTTTRKYGGSGLGLHISKRLVEMMGGTIWFESQEKRGSVFYVRVPLRREPDVAINSLHAVVPNARVVIVESHPVERQILWDRVREWGFTVEAATTCEEAKAILQALVPTVPPTPTEVRKRKSSQPVPTVLPQGLDNPKRARPTDPLVSLARGELSAQLAAEYADSRIAGPSLAPSAPANGSAVLLLLDCSFPAEQVQQLKRYAPSILLAYPYNKVDQIDTENVLRYLRKPVKYRLLRHAIRDFFVLESTPPQPPTTSFTVASVAHGVLPPNLHLLVAEDNLSTQAILRRLLISMGVADVVVVNNGQEAVAAACKENFDLILMDVMMPEMGGREATIKIRESFQARGKAPPPILALTANAFAEDARKCLETGMAAVLTKPIRRNELLEAILRYSSPGSQES